MLNLNLGNNFRKSSGTVQAYLNFGKHINDGYIDGVGAPRPSRFNSKDRLAGLSAHQNFSLFDGNSLKYRSGLTAMQAEAWNTAAADGGRLAEWPTLLSTTLQCT